MGGIKSFLFFSTQLHDNVNYNLDHPASMHDPQIPEERGKQRVIVVFGTFESTVCGSFP